ncbi:MAG: PDZ domain-containing protein, partial [Clostridia bacterium]|nr:PDZ domain-containing protein [Clostridia bacterium]
MKRFFRRLCVALTPLCMAVQATIGFYAASVPSVCVVAEGDSLTLPAPLTASGTAEDATVRLLGVFPVKQVAVKEAGDMDVVLGGTVFGMKLYTSGVLVVGLTDVDSPGGTCRPAAEAGICVGDVIEAIDGRMVATKGEVAALVEQSGGRSVTLQVRRDGISFPVQFTPAFSAGENRYKAGLWVRDRSAGIGTMSFYVPSTGVFAGLGHPICDVDTGETLPISTGEIVPARVYSITKSVRGDAGELCGGFDGTGCGKLTVNGKTGVYGLYA